MMLAVFMLAMALLIAWQRMTRDDRIILVVVVFIFALIGTLLSIVLPLVAP